MHSTLTLLEVRPLHSMHHHSAECLHHIWASGMGCKALMLLNTLLTCAAPVVLFHAKTPLRLCLATPVSASLMSCHTGGRCTSMLCS